MTTMRPTWELLESEFEWDGSWRDLYIHETSISDWQRFLGWVAGHYPTELDIDGQVKGIPPDAAEIFTWTQTASVGLRVEVHPLLVVVNFFSESEIEMTIDPREVRSQAELDVLVGFMQGMARAVAKPVKMTPENGPEYPILAVAPDGVVEYHKPRGRRAR